MAYINIDHYKLLKKLKGAVYQEFHAEQQRVYEARGQAYDIAKQGAEDLQQLGFKNSWIKTVGKATDWSGRCAAYNRAPIYSEQNFRKVLAYTVGINAAQGFVVKFDLVEAKVAERVLRVNYARIRGGFTPSPIAAVKPIPDYKAMDFAALVEWSANAIK